MLTDDILTNNHGSITNRLLVALTSSCIAQSHWRRGTGSRHPGRIRRCGDFPRRTAATPERQGRSTRTWRCGWTYRRRSACWTPAPGTAPLRRQRRPSRPSAPPAASPCRGPAPAPWPGRTSPCTCPTTTSPPSNTSTHLVPLPRSAVCQGCRRSYDTTVGCVVVVVAVCGRQCGRTGGGFIELVAGLGWEPNAASQALARCKKFDWINSTRNV
jgi:hypothetical protein